MKEANQKNSTLFKILGMLTYMKFHIEDLNIGISSIARPNILMGLKPILSKELIEKLSVCDELSGLYKLAGKEPVIIVIEECIEMVMKEISTSKNKNIDLT